MRLAVGPLGEPALAAAARFHAEVLPRAIAALASADVLTLVFEPADHTHHSWRLALVQQFAREHAPRRINAIAGDHADAIERACAWLESAPGITGQLLPLDSHGAGPVV